jgi:hypothetical protein
MKPRMITFEHGMDIRCREVATPTVARYHIGDGVYRYCVIGTQYWHTSAGDVRTWSSVGGAYKAIKRYQPL